MKVEHEDTEKVEKWYKLQNVLDGTVVVVENNNNNQGDRVQQVEQQDIKQGHIKYIEMWQPCRIHIFKMLNKASLIYMSNRKTILMSSCKFQPFDSDYWMNRLCS